MPETENFSMYLFKRESYFETSSSTALFKGIFSSTTRYPRIIVGARLIPPWQWTTTFPFASFAFSAKGMINLLWIFVTNMGNTGRKNFRNISFSVVGNRDHFVFVSVIRWVSFKKNCKNNYQIFSFQPSSFYIQNPINLRGMPRPQCIYFRSYE